MHSSQVPEYMTATRLPLSSTLPCLVQNRGCGKYVSEHLHNTNIIHKNCLQGLDDHSISLHELLVDPCLDLNHAFNGGVSAKSAAAIASGYRSPCTSAFSHACLISFSSSLVSLILSAFRFSCSLSIFVVPGIGMIYAQGYQYSSQTYK